MEPEDLWDVEDCVFEHGQHRVAFDFHASMKASAFREWWRICLVHCAAAWTNILVLWKCSWPNITSHVSAAFFHRHTLLALLYNRKHAISFTTFEVVQSYNGQTWLYKFWVLSSTFLDVNHSRNAEKKLYVAANSAPSTFVTAFFNRGWQSFPVFCSYEWE